VNWGVLLITLAFAGILTSTICFLLAALGYSRFFLPARRSYAFFAAFISLACLLLFYLFITGDYSYKYVFDHSSSDLPLLYLISAFWVGQEGTYLLWLVFLALMGYFIINRGREYTSHAMFFYGLINLFFCTILLAVSPFEKLPVPQAEGAGLNPLLQDPWMVVHPPVIFLGYAAVAVPCVIALAALARNRYDDWLKISFAPVVFAALALGAGNIMGAFWAYKTLGWGGYWSWDPVENSSLIPWLTSLAFIHGLLIERRSGSLRRTNLFLALFTFLLVIYGTFLTRSGVLAKFSVHSFVDLGVNVYLVGFMIGFALLSLVLYVLRIGRIKAPSANLIVTSQEFSLVVSVWMLLLIAVVVLTGTSWPLITAFYGSPGAVDTDMYTRLIFPLAIVISLFLGFSPFMLWKGGESGRLIKKVVIPIVAALAITIASVLMGVKPFSYLLFIFSAAFAFFSNILALSRYLPDRIRLSGPRVAHLGLAMMLIGILVSSAYSTSRMLVIDHGGGGWAYGFEITYKGMTGEITTPDNEIVLDVKDGNGGYEARPKMFRSRRRGGYIRKPYIKRHPFYDIYLAPEQFIDLSPQNGVKIARGDTIRLGEFHITFTGFNQIEHDLNSSVRIAAVLEVTDGVGRTETIVPALIFEQGKDFIHFDVPIMSGFDSFQVRLERIFADEGAIMLSVEGLTPKLPPDQLILKVSKKPAMNLLWGGAIVLLLGGFFSFRNRWKMSRTGS
jgi:cytochrome c-type biogenesis protein CcmF